MSPTFDAEVSKGYSCISLITRYLKGVVGMDTEKPLPKPMIMIQFLGNFTIECAGQSLTHDNNRTKQLWLLLEYLIVNRFTDVSLNQLTDILWPEGMVDNPANALKNLVYRLRNLLNKIGRTAENDYIVSKHSSYAWNNTLPCLIDIETLEELHQKALSPHMTTNEQIGYYLQIISLYKGDFLNAVSSEKWIVPLCNYYHNIFIECVVNVCELLFEKRLFDNVDRICSKATTIDPFEEKFHLIKMRALVASGKQSQALA